MPPSSCSRIFAADGSRAVGDVAAGPAQNRLDFFFVAPTVQRLHVLHRFGALLAGYGFIKTSPRMPFFDASFATGSAS